MTEIRTPGEGDLEAIKRVDGRAFGHKWTDEDFARQRSVIELERFRVADDHGSLVGVAGSFGLQMTVPGGAAVPTGGVTWVAVASTHRRQGLLTRLMADVHADIEARDEPLAALTASEGAIYERFGYGIATQRRMTVLDRTRAQMRPGLESDPGAVRLVEHDDPALVDELRSRWERIRRLRAGEIDRSEAWFAAQIGDRGAGATWVLHDDGFACWKIVQHWNEGHAAHEVELLDLAAATPDAHVALWRTVTSIDLVGSVRSRLLAPDDPLPYLLADPRALRTYELNDFVWCVPLDVAPCFAARSYGTDDDVVIECDGARYRVGAGGVKRVRSRPDLVAERSALGPLLMGVAPTTLTMGRRLTARSAEALRRADALLTAHPMAHGMSGF